MFTQSLIFVVIVILYVSSLLLYFYDILQANRKVNQIAFWLLAIVWLLQAMFLVTRAIEQGNIPLFSQFDTLLFYAWLLISISLVINWLYRMAFMLFFVNLIGFVVVTISLMVASQDIPYDLSQQISAEWLLIHISMAFLSYAAFTLSFIFSVLYTVQNKLLKQKKWNKFLRRLPGLIQLEQYAFHLNLLGFPLLLISLILGVISAYHQLDLFFLLDSKVIFSTLTLLMYGLFLYQRSVKKWQGRAIAELNLICFAVLLINYFISSLFSQFHMWL
jgi:HemX protein